MKTVIKYFLAGAASSLVADFVAPKVTPAGASELTGKAVKYGTAGLGVYLAHRLFHAA